MADEEKQDVIHITNECSICGSKEFNIKELMTRTLTTASEGNVIMDKKEFIQYAKCKKCNTEFFVHNEDDLHKTITFAVNEKSPDIIEKIPFKYIGE